MSRKSFTLLEILIGMVIIGILASVALPSYQSMVEEANAKVCQTNQEAIVTSLEIYAHEHDTMPGSLSALPKEYLERAYAKILKEKETWKIKIAELILNFHERNVAYAETIPFLRLVAEQGKLLICPGNKGSGPSYGVNQIIFNLSSAAYLNLASTYPDYDVIADCDNLSFAGSKAPQINRHKEIRGFTSEFYMISITPNNSCAVRRFSNPNKPPKEVCKKNKKN